MNSARRIRLIRIISVIGVALGAGHVAQSSSTPKIQYAALIPDLTPAGPVSLVAMQLRRTEPAVVAADLPIVPVPDRPPAVATPVRLDVPDPVVAEAAVDCTPHLSLSAGSGATIDVALTAPCQPEARVVLQHAGLAVTYRTNPAGALKVQLPALVADARVSILFAGGEMVGATLALPEAASQRRFGVQWMGAQTLAVNPAAEDSGPGGVLTLLGDAGVDTPMLARIYTYPAERSAMPLTLEAAITPATCGQEILGETLTVSGGTVKVADLSVTMPGCDAVGDYLVLKNIVPDLKLAAAN